MKNLSRPRTLKETALQIHGLWLLGMGAMGTVSLLQEMGQPEYLAKKNVEQLQEASLLSGVIGSGLLEVIVTRWQHFGWVGTLSAFYLKGKPPTDRFNAIREFRLAITVENFGCWEGGK